MSKPDQHKLDIYVEEYRHMAPLIGASCTVHRLADAYGIKPNSMRKALYERGIYPPIDEREVPA